MVAKVSFRPPNLASCQPQPVKCLRAGHFVHQVAIDVEQAGTIRQFTHHVGCPDFFEQCFSHGLIFLLGSGLFGPDSILNGDIAPF
jgi:hypothetical protein